MKYYLILLLIFALGCAENIPKDNPKEIVTNLYDLYYSEMLKRNKDFYLTNRDSIPLFTEVDDHFSTLQKKGILDSTVVDNGMKTKDSNTFISGQRVILSDSIHRRLQQNSSKPTDFTQRFSAPFSISKDLSLVFVDSYYFVTGYSRGVVLFDKTDTNSWKVKDIVLLNQYRVGLPGREY